MTRLTLSLLGSFQAELDGDPITDFESSKVRGLLAYLAVESDRTHPRETLAGLLWPDWPERSARSNLRYALSNLRQAIGDREAEHPFLHISRSALQFDMDADVTLDVADFERLSARALSSGEADTSRLKQAVALCRGPFLDGFSVADAEPFEAWARSTREYLSQRLSVAYGVLTTALEEQGDLVGARDYARQWIEVDLVNEAAHRCLMRVLAYEGDRTAALAQYDACCQVLRQELDVAPSQETVALYEAIRDERLSQGLSAAELAEAPAPGEPPYKGLQHFGVGDADLFHGREALTETLVEHLDREPFLAVIGASGSGKSSLVRAGLIPTLRDRAGFARQIHLITPTARPLMALAASLTRDAESVTQTTTLRDDLMTDSRALLAAGQKNCAASGATRSGLLLVIDQFEELFTLCRDEAARCAFVENLVHTAAGSSSGPVVTVVVLRADFYAHCGQYDGLRDLLARHQVYIGPMGIDELRQAIEAPAQQGDWAFEPGLVDLMLRDVGQEPGALPLLSHALLETWRRRRGRTMTLGGYDDAGGVRGAIAKTAESVYRGLGAARQAVARSICMRLTELGEGTEDTRRRATLSEVMSIPASSVDVETVLHTLADARLITVAQNDVQVAHEALIREWPTLRGWLEEDREGLRVHRHLTESAQEWARLGKESGELYRGARLAQAAEWARGHDAQPNHLERAFLQASEGEARRREAQLEAQRQRELAAAQELAKAERQRAEQQITATRRLRRRAGYLIVALVLACVLGVLAGLSRQEAQEQLHIAEEQRNLALSRELASAALHSLQVDPERSVLLNLHALEYGHTSEAINALHQTVRALRSLLTLDHAGIQNSVSGGHVREGVFYQGVQEIVFRPDGALLATSYGSGVIGLWDVQDGTHLQSYEPNHSALEVLRLAFSPDGADLAFAARRNDVQLWRLQSEASPANSEQYNSTLNHHGVIRVIAFSPDGTRFLSGGADGLVYVSDVLSREILLTLSGHEDAPPAVDGYAGVTDAAFDPRGELVATADSGGTVRVWDAESGAQRFTIAAHNQSIGAVAFGRLCGHQAEVSHEACQPILAVASFDGTAEVWDLSMATSQAQQRLGVDIGAPLNSAAFSPDSRYLALGGEDGISVWDVMLGRRVCDLYGHMGSIQGVAFSPDGMTLATCGADNTVRIWDVSPGETLLTISDLAGYATSVALGPDCAPSECTQLLAAGDDRGTIYVWDSVTGEEHLRVSAHEGRVAQVALGPEGTYVASAGEDGRAKLWDISTGEPVLVVQDYAPNSAVAISPDGTRLVVGSVWGIAQGWDIPGRSLLWKRRLDSNPISRLRFSEEGSRVFSGSWDGSVTLLDASDGDILVHDTIDPLGYTSDYAFSRDGQRLITARRGGLAEIWETVSGELELVSTLHGHAEQVLSVAYSPDGKYVATGGYDGAAKVWDVAASISWGSGVEVLSLENSGGQVVGLAFNGDGSRLVTATLNGTVRTYVLSLDEMIALARERVTRTLTNEECRRYLHVERCPELP